MRLRYTFIMMILPILSILPTRAQIFNFSLRTTNQQLIDLALNGVFVRIDQSYELCDTIRNEYFGRNDKDYFSMLPFIGIITEKGLVFPSTTLTPWKIDKDFAEYQNLYKPILTTSKITTLNKKDKTPKSGEFLNSNSKLSDRLSCACDSTLFNAGLKPDTAAGAKEGWLVWITSSREILENDSIKLYSVRKNLEVPQGCRNLKIEKPDISGTVYGGIYIVPEQTELGTISFTLSGVALLENEEWIVEFPFMEEPGLPKILTPIGRNEEKKNQKYLKPRKK